MVGNYNTKDINCNPLLACPLHAYLMPKSFRSYKTDYGSNQLVVQKSCLTVGDNHQQFPSFTTWSAEVEQICSNCWFEFKMVSTLLGCLCFQMLFCILIDYLSGSRCLLFFLLLSHYDKHSHFSQAKLTIFQASAGLWDLISLRGMWGRPLYWAQNLKCAEW